MWIAAVAVLATPTVGEDRPFVFDGKSAKEMRADNSVKMKLVWCPAGEFHLGTAGATGNEKPVRIMFHQGFWIGQTEVTRKQWEEIMNTTPWKDDVDQRRGLPGQEAGDYPASFVNWNQGSQFCEKLTGIEREAGRLPQNVMFSLPSEAEWEYACRAGTTTTFSFGGDEARLGEFAWYVGNAWDADERYPHRVGFKKPNPWGIHDMHGNVDEWCADGDSAEELPPHTGEIRSATDPKAKYRMIRGGEFSAPASHCRSAYREGGAKPHTRISSTGLRVVLIQDSH